MNPGHASAERLRSGAVGKWGIAALVIGVTSPAIGLFATWGPIEAAAGPIAPLVYLAALVIIFPTVLSYAALNRDAPSAAGVAAWIWPVAGPFGGSLAGIVTLTYFIMAATTVPLLFGLFFADLLTRLRVPLPAAIAVIAGLVLHSALVGVISLRGARASVRTTMMLMLLETVVVLALSATILVVKASVPGAINAAPFVPASALHGFSGFWSAVLLGMLAFAGFDVVAVTAEEAAAPRRDIPVIMTAAIVGITLFWMANAWAFTIATSPAQVEAYSVQGLTAITPVAGAYWGWGDLIVIATAFTGLTAVYLSCVQGASRLMFALGRQGVLPAVFGRVAGAARVPRAAVIFVVVLCTTLALLSMLFLRNGLQGFIWWSEAMVFFAALTFIAVNAANMLRIGRTQRGWLRLAIGLVVPLAGAGLSLYLLWAAFFSALWSAPFPTGRSVVDVCVVLFALQIVGVAAITTRGSDLRRSNPPLNAEPVPILPGEGIRSREFA